MPRHVEVLTGPSGYRTQTYGTTYREELEALRTRAVTDLKALIFGKIGEKLEGFERRAGIDPSVAGGIPVQLRLPAVREMLPQAALFIVPLLVLGMIFSRKQPVRIRRRSTRRRRRR